MAILKEDNCLVFCFVEWLSSSFIFLSSRFNKKCFINEAL